jgi:putative nucleotidyltransferase with HDIG domain
VKQPSREDIIAKIEAFPNIPSAAAKILSLLDDPDTSAQEIGEILRYDPGLTANILKLTNSSYFGLPSKVGSVNQALVLLGWKKLAQLIVSACASAVMVKPVPGYDLQPGELWRHSIAVSVVAEGLSRELGLTGVDEIFTAALLHDVGKLVLGDFIRRNTSSVDDESLRTVSFEKVERRLFGTDHAEIGAQILTGWSFPENIVAAVRWHHDPDAADKIDNLIDVVHIANVLCLMIGIGIGREGLQYTPSEAATRRLDIKGEQLEMVAAQAVGWVEELSESFSVHFEEKF